MAFLCFLSHSLVFSVRRRLGVIKSSNFATFWAALVRGLGPGGNGIIEANLLFWYFHICFILYLFYKMKDYLEFPMIT